MRRLLLCTFLAVTSLAHAAGDSARQHVILANVLATDAANQSITYRDENGTTTSSLLLAPINAAALARLESGDLVELTVRDKANGEREGVLEIKLVATVR